MRRMTLIDRPSVLGLHPATVLAGFRIGLFTSPDVADWATHRAAKLEPVPEALLQLIPIVGLDDAAIAAALEELAGPMDAGQKARLGVDALCVLYRMGVLDARRFAGHLDALLAWNLDVLPEALVAEGYGLDDGFALADGEFGSVEVAEERVAEFVERFERELR